MPVLQQLFARAGQGVPLPLANWDERVACWCDEYASQFTQAELSEVNLDFALFIFDHAAERVILAYAVSVEQLHPRDSNRMRGFPDVNATVQKLLGPAAFPADRGHLLGHASGGVLDINLFPQRRDLNRGWSPEGKRFRAMERYVACHPGSFFYHRPRYDDDTWVPATLEYAVLRQDGSWWTDTFRNKSWPSGRLISTLKCNTERQRP